MRNIHDGNIGNEILSTNGKIIYYYKIFFCDLDE